jgi:hypothetical protein
MVIDMAITLGLEHGPAMACCQAFDFLNRKQTVRGGFPWSNAKKSAKGLKKRLCPA